VTLDSVLPGRGVGTNLIEAVRTAAIAKAARRLWLTTTNDNLNALRFYQKPGFRFVAIYPGAAEKARQLKSLIPNIGLEGIPIRDELELELPLSNIPAEGTTAHQV
jgi:hypothetical protein